jgi:16S rRNA (cytidine1402-2'-O)-methyltransferase
MRSTLPGTLYVVALPIGNPDDLTVRALRTLREVDVILSEDTRRTRALLTAVGLADETPGPALRRFDAHVEGTRLDDVVTGLRAGEAMALVSDAGTPGVSDPGHRLVRAVREAGLPVIPVPGASAVTAALSVSGLGATGFTFHGFLPKADSARRETLAALPDGTHAFFTPARDLPAVLSDAAAIPALREAFVARELTKTHETFYRGAPGALAPSLAADPEAVLGEAVVLFEVETSAPDEAAVRAALSPLLARGTSARDAARLVAERLGLPRRQVYQLALTPSGLAAPAPSAPAASPGETP